MRKNRLIPLTILFVISLITLTTSIFAWFSITYEVRIGNIVSNVVDGKANLTFELKKNDSDYYIIKTVNELTNALENIIPNDELTFKVRIENTGNVELLTKVILRNIVSNESTEEFNMFDVFFLKDGIVNIYTNKLSNYDFDNELPDNILNYYLDNENEEPVILHEGTQYEQTLNPYRLSNLLENYNLLLLDNYNLEPNNNITLLYTIKYDQKTSHPNYEGKDLKINSIFVYLN